MTKPSFIWQLSIGNVIQIALLLLAAGIGWATFDARISTVETSTTTIIQVQADHATRLRRAETDAARSDERMNHILSLFAQIDKRLERIEQREN